MVATLSGIAFSQVMGDNSGGVEFDTDGDGVTTQEDEFVSILNTTGAPIDVSGWQIWSDSTGGGAPDTPLDGLFHTFPPGTIIAPGQSLWNINEITDPNGRYFAQESSKGGAESGGGGVSTNFLSEGNSGNPSEAVYLVNPTTGQYLTFNMSSSPPKPSVMPGFPGTTQGGLIDGHSVKDDMAAGMSYQYDRVTDSYTYLPAYIPCFAAGTLIDTAAGPCAVENLRPGMLLRTVDAGFQPLCIILHRKVTFETPATEAQRPIRFAAHSLAPGQPDRPLAVSPQHRMLITVNGEEMLVPARYLLDRPGVRVMHGLREVAYYNLVLSAHHIVTANGAAAESFLFGPYSHRAMPRAARAAIQRLDGDLSRPARPLGRLRLPA